ncbi:hypothetical protein AU381_10885 [Sinorhizobium glycinis]|uniref:Phosphatidic acid phosphatase type 2/haloperoxidase domain-containing protein n=1 Tax=Sinorhizobium glycinis TaxID=1472378 RepID=A0A178XZX5_9HYPH|nr:phosphatase PAP2 family protein [Sinorhizobium glycinis]OAP40035.1 hypothetical protein AU381_10885 [Sinorhizobium glycinis]
MAEPMARRLSDLHRLTQATALFLLFVGTSFLALNPDWIDRPLAKAINTVASNQPFATRLASGAIHPTTEGAIVVSLLWCCWFSHVGPESRARLVSGVCAAVLAAFVAHFLQDTLPTTPKPIFDPALRLQIPDVLGDAAVLRSAPFAGSPGFPSERAVLFVGLAIAILLVHFELGLLALVYALLVELARVYLGLHYPTNALGSLTLAATLAWLSQTRPSLELGALILLWERGAAPSFYLCSFQLSYLIIAFQELRELAESLLP